MNFIYRANKWLDSSNYTLLIILIPIITANLLLVLTDFILTGVSLLSIICVLSLIRIRIQTGQLKFNRDVYDIPSIGEIIKIKKRFYWNGSLHKYCPKTDMLSKPWYFIIDQSGEWRITNVREIDGDWMIYLDKCGSEGDSIHITYFESRKYWETKSDIRNKKLNKLGI